MTETKRKKLVDSEKSEQDSASAFVHTISLGSKGELLDAHTHQPVEDFSRLISRCKYGDNAAADELADQILETASESSAYQTFLTTSHQGERALILTSHGIYNVPTASALIVQRLAERMNVSLANKDMPGVIVDTPLPSSVIGVITGAEQSLFSYAVIDGLTNYKGCDVIFVDDMLLTQEHEEKISRYVIEECGANSVFFLYGAKLEEESFRQTNQVLERVVANREIDGSLESLLPMLKEPHSFTVVQRLLRTVLHPDNKHKLPNYFKLLPDESLLKMYKAASSADFSLRFNGMYKSAICILKEELIARGWVSPEGTLYRKQKFITKEEFSLAAPHQVAVHRLNSKHDISLNDAQLYSRMKYCDPAAVREVANRMAESILKDEQFRSTIQAGKPLYITSSAYGSVPTASTFLTDQIEQQLLAAGVQVKRIKIERKGQFAKQDFGSLSAEERQAAMKARKLELDDDTKAVISGGTVLLVDDLCATGSHEQSIRKVLEEAGVATMFSAYFVKFTEKLMVNEPDTEEWLNRASAKTPLDFLGWMKGLPENSFQANARLVKMLLTTSAEPKQGITADQRKSDLQLFLVECENSVLIELYQAAISEDGYFAMPQYLTGFQLLEAEAIRRKLISVTESNRFHHRVTTCCLTIHEGTFRDIESGRDHSELIKKYSLMKFGAPGEIAWFAKEIAAHYLVRLQFNKDGLRDFYQSIKDRGEYISLFVPGSRNVPSASNFVLQQAVEQINIGLAVLDLPTIIVVHLPRLESNTANYAQLSAEERAARPQTTKTLLPGSEFYQNPMHVIFGDDVRITGATADRVRQDCLAKGAVSFSELYGLQIDPSLALTTPEVENTLNTAIVTGGLDQNIVYILNHPEFQPVQRMVRLVLSESNRDQLASFLNRYISDEALIKLYIATTNNDYLKNEKYRPSGQVLRTVLFERQLITSSGLLIRK